MTAGILTYLWVVVVSNYKSLEASGEEGMVLLLDDLERPHPLETKRPRFPWGPAIPPPPPSLPPPYSVSRQYLPERLEQANAVCWS